jgi:hypothetical protein
VALKSNSYKVRNQKRTYSEFGSLNELKYGDELIFQNDIQWYKIHDGADGTEIKGILNIK